MKDEVSIIKYLKFLTNKQKIWLIGRLQSHPI